MNLIRLNELTSENIKEIFTIADGIVEGEFKDILIDKTAVLFFPQSSIRTRISFEKGIHQLGGQPILFSPETLDKREELKDVIAYIENWCDLAIVRHKDIAVIEKLTEHSNIPIINAMTGDNHPCEILSDLYALSKIRDDYLSMNYTFVGEKANISKSYAAIAEILGLNFRHVCTEGNRIKNDDEYYHFTTDLSSVTHDTDIFLTDPLSKTYRNQNYYDNYQIDKSILDKSKSNSLLNPCPPFFRGEEVSKDAIDSEHFVGYKFKKSLLIVQQAIIIYCLTK